MFKLNIHSSIKPYKLEFTNDYLKKLRSLYSADDLILIDSQIYKKFNLPSSINSNNILSIKSEEARKEYSEIAKIIYLIDVFPLTKKNIEAAVNELSKINLDTDLIIYIGELQKVPKNLIKIPDFLLKNQRNISGKILNPTQLDEKIYNISNWNINLSNFDIK